MMMNMPGVSHAVELAKLYPKLQVGIHLVLTCGKPLLSDVPSLVDENGNFKRLTDFMNDRELSLLDLEREWNAQIERFLETGLIPSHFDSHHHVHAIPEISSVVQKLSSKYKLSARQAAEQIVEGIPSYTDVFLHDFYGDGVTEDYFEKLSSRVRDGQTVEVMCHPGYLDHHVLNGSSYTSQRIEETRILTSVTLPKNIELL